MARMVAFGSPAVKEAYSNWDQVVRKIIDAVIVLKRHPGVDVHALISLSDEEERTRAALAQAVNGAGSRTGRPAPP